MCLLQRHCGAHKEYQTDAALRFWHITVRVIFFLRLWYMNLSKCLFCQPWLDIFLRYRCNLMQLSHFLATSSKVIGLIVSLIQFLNCHLFKVLENRPVPPVRFICFANARQYSSNASLTSLMYTLASFFSRDLLLILSSSFILSSFHLSLAL